MSKINKIYVYNQVIGPLFRELILGIDKKMYNQIIVLTGNPESFDNISKTSNIIVKKAKSYNRKNSFNRIFSWFAFTLQTTRYILKSNKNDLLIFVSNPPILSIWVTLINYFKKISYVAVIYDIYPEILIRKKLFSRDNIFIKFWIYLNKIFYKKSIFNFTIANNMLKFLQKNYIENNPKNLVIMPWVDENKIKPLSKIKNPYYKNFITEYNKKVVLYSGNMGKSHDIKSILKSALILKDYDDIIFLMIGHGEEFNNCIEFQKKNSLSNLKIFPFQSEKLIPYTFPLADIAIVSQDDGMEELMIPSKFAFYLSSGAALIAITRPGSEIYDIINDNKLGLVVNPNNPNSIASSILKILNNSHNFDLMRHNARKYTKKNLSMSNGIKLFNNYLKKII